MNYNSQNMSETCFKTDAMRELRRKWTLGNDVDVLNQLESFSQGLINRTSCLLNNLDQFEKELKVSKLEVNIISNSFEAVSDTQFVESRVCDEEEDVVASTHQVDKKDVGITTSNNLNERLEDALKTCSKILDSKFEAVSIPLSDSEDDGDVSTNSEIIFIPKNKYKSRPLPHIIGGEDFYKDDTLGLLINHNSIEEINENIMNGDETITQSESSSLDEPDESSATQEFNFGKAYDINSLSDSKENTDLLGNSQEDLWKDSTSQNNNKESIPEKKDDPLSSPEKSDLSIPSNIPSGINLKSSIHDELKQLFSPDGEMKPKLKTLIKTQDTSQKQKFLNSEVKGPLPSSPFASDEEPLSDKMPILAQKSIMPQKSVVSPKKNLILPEYKKSVENPLLQEENPPLSHQKSESPNHIFPSSDKKPSISSKESISTDDSLLPNVPTEILPSFAKERAKIKGKRRLPSRKPRRNANEREDQYTNINSKENPVLSPSTDEEDLFVLPDSQNGKDTPGSSLFMKTSLFSPGSSIEKNTNSLFEERQNEEDKLEEATNDAIFDEPLGVHKEHSLTSRNGSKNKNLFNDWDPFDSEENGLFQTIERKPHKTRLFDDLIESSGTSVTIDDDLFSDSSSFSKSSSLFESTSSSVSRPSDLLNKKKSMGTKTQVSKLFSDESDDDDDENIFSERSSYKSPFSLSFDKRKNGAESPKKNKSEKISSRKTYSNPLSDSDDNLFD